MGRRKIEIAPLPTARARQVTFYKRKAGLLKKANELACLTGAEIYLEIKFGNRMTRLGSPCLPEQGIIEQNLSIDVPQVSPLSPGSICSSSSSSPPVVSPTESTFHPQEFAFPFPPESAPHQPTSSIEFAPPLPPFYQLAPYTFYNNNS